MSDDRETLEGRIRERAYHLWIEAGRPDGRDQELWFLAREAETGSLSVPPDAFTPVEAQLMAEGEPQPLVPPSPHAAAETDGVTPNNAANGDARSAPSFDADRKRD